MPVMADALLDSISLLARSTDVLARSCVAGLTADSERMRAFAEASPALATALNRTLGYERGAALVKQAAAGDVVVADLVRRLVAEGALPASALDALDPLPLARPEA
jgi:fumarate hydratase class II